MKKNRKWSVNNLLYIKSSEADKTINDFVHIHENRRDGEYRKKSNNTTLDKLDKKVREIEKNELKYKFIIICDLKKNIEREKREENRR